MNIGYIRISTTDQNTARQEVLMKELGVEQVYIDRMSGKNTGRPELKRMLGFVREGDVVIVESISRFARNTKDLLELVEQLSSKQVEFISKQEAIDTTTPTGKFMLTVFGAVAELEREYILQRQKEGIAIAKEKGVYKGRKPIEHPKFDEVVSLWKSGNITATEAMKRLDMKPSTFYRKVKKQHIKHRLFIISAMFYEFFKNKLIDNVVINSSFKIEKHFQKQLIYKYQKKNLFHLYLCNKIRILYHHNQNKTRIR